MSEFRAIDQPLSSTTRSAAMSSIGRNSITHAGARVAARITPPILVPLTAAAAIAAYGFYLRLF